ncbi:MAG: Nitrogen regulatory protein [Verrucomicrobia bacterium ADurb.Bin070]|jgi:PTS system nitrogen regulatory IIA component|nr:MAG: Nitrogen regulatory protein [Verrucomicrobia bacterium ADurb.Bin070]
MKEKAADHGGLFAYYMKLSVKDAALFLSVSPETVYRWVKQEEIPYHTVNDQLRFNRAELLEWATARSLEVSPDLFVPHESALSALPTVSQALTAGGIAYGVPGGSQAEVLHKVVGLMKLPSEVDRDYLYQVLLAREGLGSTGIGDGIAIPHVRNPLVLHVTQPSITLCFLASPIDFHALDGKPVNTLFTLISPTVKTHLHLLSWLSYALRNPVFKEAVKRQAPCEELMARLAAAEAAVGR